MKNQSKEYYLKQIEYLERDINMISDIILGKIENYTKHPIPVLLEALSIYQNKLIQFQENILLLKGGI